MVKIVGSLADLEQLKIKGNTTMAETQEAKQRSYNNFVRSSAVYPLLKNGIKPRWNIPVKELWAENPIPSLNLFQDFEKLKEKIELYTMFIDSYYLYNYCKDEGVKIHHPSLTKGDKIAEKIWYYIVTSFSSNAPIFQFYIYYIANNPRIESYYDSINATSDMKNLDTSAFSTYIANKKNEILTPRMYVDMLNLLIRTDSVSRSVSDVLLFCTMPSLSLAIKVLQENDIKVHLGVYNKISIPTVLLESVDSIFDMTSYFKVTGVML
jgi:hypothetical protein